MGKKANQYFWEVTLAILFGVSSSMSTAVAETQTPLQIAIADFVPATAPSLKLVGNAKVEGNSLRLTEAKNWLQGVALFNTPQTLTPSRSFSTHFSMTISDPICHQGLGADGISFLIQGSSHTKHAPGNGVGYAGTEMSLAVEFDTYHNGEFQDPPGQHIGLSLHGDPSSYAATLSPYTLNDGRLYYVWIEYDGTSKFMEVRISDGTTRPAEATMRTQVDLSGVLEDAVFIGFSASTGACNEQHEIKTLYFHNNYLKDGIKVSAAS